MNDNKIYDITKEYTEMFRVTSYKYPFNRDSLSSEKRENKSKIKKVTEDNLQRSVRRSRTVISDYVRNNKFNLFVTFTFSPEKVDRYDLLATSLKMQGWLHRQQRKYPGFRYIIVPEHHEDGAIHFHALLGGWEGKLFKTHVLMNSKRVYNINSFTFGFTNAQYIDDDIQKTTAYICKYIKKEMALVFGRRRYWNSKNLVKPISHYNRVYDMNLLSSLIPKNVVYETEYNVIYEFPKPIFD